VSNEPLFKKKKLMRRRGRGLKKWSKERIL